MLDFQGLGSSRPQHERMTHDNHLPDRPEIGEVIGERSHLRVLSVDGLCVAIVDRPTSLENAASDLKHVMVDRQSSSGSLLLGPKGRLDMSMQLRKDLANKGISVKRSSTDDLFAAAEGMLNAFWRRHRVTQERYQAAHE